MAYFKGERELLRSANNMADLFKGCHNVYGPLDKEIRDSILSFLNEPTTENWAEIYPVLITSIDTCWSAWIKVDPSAPLGLDVEGVWPNIPSREMLILAIREAVRSRQKEVESVIKKGGLR